MGEIVFFLVLEEALCFGEESFVDWPRRDCCKEWKVRKIVGTGRRRGFVVERAAFLPRRFSFSFCASPL